MDQQKDAREKDSASPPEEGKSSYDESCLSKYTSCRWRIAYTSFFATMLLFAFRHCFSFAIVCMEAKYIPTNGTLPAQNGTKSVNSNSYIPQHLRGVILSSYYYGYVTMPVIGGFLAARLGPKLVLGVSMGLASVTMTLLPLCVRASVYLAIADRVILGFLQGSVQPSIQVILANWAPLAEKARLSTVSMSGISLGTIVATLISSLLCQIPVDEGWPIMFYVYGGMGAIWVIAWLLIVYNSPETHPRCSELEKKRIYLGKTTLKHSRQILPWTKAFRNLPFWTLICCNMSHAWFMTTFNTFLPIYMNEVLKFDLTQNGVLSSLPHIVRLVSGFIFSSIADQINNRTKTRVGVNRKIFQFIGTVIPGGIIIGISFLRAEQRVLAVGLMVLAFLASSSTLTGFRVNQFDIAPRFAGQVVGLTISTGAASAVIIPLVVSAITVDRTPEQWQTVFCITSGLNILSCVFFVICGSGEEQDWAKADDSGHVDVPQDADHDNTEANQHGSRVAQNGRTQNETQSLNSAADEKQTRLEADDIAMFHLPQDVAHVLAERPVNNAVCSNHPKQEAKEKESSTKGEEDKYILDHDSAIEVYDNRGYVQEGPGIDTTSTCPDINFVSDTDNVQRDDEHTFKDLNPNTVTVDVNISSSIINTENENTYF